MSAGVLSAAPSRGTFHQGTQCDAILFACGANARHGLNVCPFSVVHQDAEFASRPAASNQRLSGLFALQPPDENGAWVRRPERGDQV
jgi:hypothetical protein